MDKFFKLKENGTSVGTEVLAGITTFVTMAYILIVNPQILGQAGMPTGAVFIATILASATGTLIVGLYANVPYALAPGMGLNAFFAFTVVLINGFSWQEALAMVFICGIVNMIITITKIRTLIIKAIPESLQHAIGGGIGLFIAYIGCLNVGLIEFNSNIPALGSFSNPTVLLCVIGLIISIVLIINQVKGGILIGIILTTLIGIPMGVVDLSHFSSTSFTQMFSEFSQVFGTALGSNGMGSLFSDPTRFTLIFMTVFAFSLTDIFDTIGTFIGTGRRTGIFSTEDEKGLEEGKSLSSKMEKALFGDMIATTVGAIFGTSNTTTYVESSAGIGVGGRTGLTAVVVAICFLLSIVFGPFITIIPAAATAPALIIVGVMMSASFADIKWDNLMEALPCFFTIVFMTLAYSITTGIAMGFITYVLVRIAKGKWKELNPIVLFVTGLFILNYALPELIKIFS